MRAVAVPMADPQLDFHWIPDPGFLIQGFLIQCRRRIYEDVEKAPTLVLARPALGPGSVRMPLWPQARRACAPICGPGWAWPGPA